MSHSIKLESIRIDGGTQPRAEINQEAVNEYADAMAAGVEFPPVVVFFDGAERWLADGFHRYHAARSVGLDKIAAQEKKGTKNEAILYAVGANATHGMRRTNEDKRRAVRMLLAVQEWRIRSDHWIAEQCGVSQPFVGSVRDQAKAVIASRTGRDGKTYPATNVVKRPEPSPEPEPVQPRESNTKRKEAGPPCMGMQYARIAIMQLEEISSDDTERDEALNHVARWIKGQQK